MRQNRIIPIALVTAVITVAATACASSGGVGSSGGSGDSGGSSAQAMTLLAKMTAPQAVAQSSKAVASKQSAKVHMDVTSPAMNETADGGVAFSPSLGMDVKVTMSSANAQASPLLAQMGQMEVRMTNLVAYIDLGHDQQVVDALQGKHWVKIDFDNLDGIPALSGFAAMKNLGKNEDPGIRLKALLASPNLKQVGREQRDGVQTLHFSGTVQPNDVIKAGVTSLLSQKDIDSLNATAKQEGVTNTSYDLWVDGAGLPVEVKFSEAAKAGTVNGDVVYSDWGTPVSVTAPPAGQTVDIAQMIKQQG